MTPYAKTCRQQGDGLLTKCHMFEPTVVLLLKAPLISHVYNMAAVTARGQGIHLFLK